MKMLTKAVQGYLCMRCQLGFKLKGVANILNRFAAYMENKKASHITSKLALDFVMQNPNCSRSHCAIKLGVIRRFATYLRTMDPLTEVPADLLPYLYQRRHPYIYSDDDIFKLLKSCTNLSAHCPLRPHTYYTLFGLIAVTGMRTSEAIALLRESVDLTNGIITIRESKFRKSRKIPIHASTVKQLARYVENRDLCFGKKQSSYFFVNNKGNGLSAYIARYVFNKICLATGLRKKDKCGGPRIIDFRHTFAIKTLMRCYQEGLSTDAVIPALSLYLGHENPLNTYWYLTSTPELLSLVNAHLEKKARG